jgi:hypothetical protein
MKIAYTIPAFICLFAGMRPASAQTGPINVYFGTGAATDSSSKQSIDTFGTGNPFTTPKMGGLFSDLGASAMLTRHFGVGGDYSWRDTQAAYAGLNYRPLFYNIDGVYQPSKSKRFEPEFRAGLGGAAMHFTYKQTACNQFTGCSTSNAPVANSDHFAVHTAAAARLYVTNNVFVRPAFDLRYVNNFFQFGHNWVPEYSVGVGWSFGRGE